MAAALMALILLAPDGKKWSETHPVGMWIPQGWKVEERDAGERVFVIRGPKLGPGNPRAALRYAGAASGTTLDAIATKLEKQVTKRPGWRTTARVRKSIGPFPAFRVGLRFRLESGAKGRGRFTVALLGGRFYVLELSAPAAHFPGSIFDQMEKSLAARWTEHKLSGGFLAKAPAGWEGLPDERGLVLEGPSLAGKRVLLLLVRETEAERPKGAEAGPKLTLLGKKRESLLEKRGKGEDEVRMVWVHADGWTGRVFLPASSWDDLFPTAEAILASLRPPAAGKD